MSDQRGFLVVARSLADFMMAGASTEGYTIRACEVCHEPLGISGQAMEQVARGAYLLCNMCGKVMLERLEAAGQNVEVIRTEAAEAQSERLRAMGKKDAF